MNNTINFFIIEITIICKFIRIASSFGVVVYTFFISKKSFMSWSTIIFVVKTVINETHLINLHVINKSTIELNDMTEQIKNL